MIVILLRIKIIVIIIFAIIDPHVYSCDIFCDHNLTIWVFNYLVLTFSPQREM